MYHSGHNSVRLADDPVTERFGWLKADDVDNRSLSYYKGDLLAYRDNRILLAARFASVLLEHLTFRWDWSVTYLRHENFLRRHFLPDEPLGSITWWIRCELADVRESTPLLFELIDIVESTGIMDVDHNQRLWVRPNGVLVTLHAGTCVDKWCPSAEERAAALVGR